MWNLMLITATSFFLRSRNRYSSIMLSSEERVAGGSSEFGGLMQEPVLGLIDVLAPRLHHALPILVFRG
jgi:hypothetical protein